MQSERFLLITKLESLPWLVIYAAVVFKLTNTIASEGTFDHNAMTRSIER